MSWHFSRALAAASSADTCSAGEPSVPSSSTPTPETFSWLVKTTGPSRRSRSGMTSEPLTDARGQAALTWSLAASRARTSAQLARGLGSTASEAASGATWRGSFVKFDPASSLWKTAQCSLLEGLDVYLETWPRSGSMLNGACWERTTVVPRTGASGFGLLPTPTAQRYGTNQGGKAGRTGKVRASLQTMATRGSFPTPTAGDAKASGSAGYSTASGRHSGTTLTDAVVRFPTPASSDAKRGKAYEKRDRPNGATLSESLGPESARARGQLNPTWVEWLMGWPLGWTDCEPLETAKFREWQQQHSNSCASAEGYGVSSR